MFDSYIHKSESKVIAVTKEIEKTITPDRVVDMYDKVKEEVENAFVRGFIIESNSMNGVVVQFDTPVTTHRKKIYTTFRLNGVDHTDSSYVDIDVFSEGQAFKMLADHYGNIVGGMILKDIVGTTTKGFQLRRSPKQQLEQ